MNIYLEIHMHPITQQIYFHNHALFFLSAFYTDLYVFFFSIFMLLNVFLYYLLEQQFFSLNFIFNR